LDEFYDEPLNAGCKWGLYVGVLYMLDPRESACVKRTITASGAM